MPRVKRLGRLAVVTLLSRTSAGYITSSRLSTLTICRSDLLCKTKTLEPSSDGVFSTKAVKNRLSNPKGLDRCLSRTWHRWIPPKVSIFVWRLRHLAVATDSQVQQCGVPLASKCRCCALPAAKSIEHLFVLSDPARLVWDYGYRIFGVRMPRSLHQLWSLWVKDGHLHSFVDALRLVWFCCGVWELWKLRNNAIHGSGSYDIIRKLRLWMPAMAPLIPLPYKSGFQSDLALGIFHLQRHYRPKVRWKHWCPAPVGFTLNCAWIQHEVGSIACYVLRDASGSVKWSKVHLTGDSLDDILQSLIDIHALPMLPIALQSCHPIINVLKARRPLHFAAPRIHGLIASAHRVCPTANALARSMASPAFLGRLNGDPVSLPSAVRQAIIGDRLKLPSPCLDHQCRLHPPWVAP
ncbi:hypothetical protein QQ045_020439 [Rhodiola kirilowii]